MNAPTTFQISDWIAALTEQHAQFTEAVNFGFERDSIGQSYNNCAEMFDALRLVGCPRSAFLDNELEHIDRIHADLANWCQAEMEKESR